MDWRTWLDRLTVSRPALSRSRIRSAYAVAVATDILQFLLGPLGWAFSDEILDIIALVVTTKLLGFHPLLLPTFVLELVPVADMLPTWTACVALVIAMKKKQPPSPGPDQEGTTIDVKPTRVT